MLEYSDDTSDAFDTEGDEPTDGYDAGFDDGDDEPQGRLAGVRVLIVDDDRDILESFTVALRAEGALTRGVADGNSAVDICEHETPDLVVLDMMLPGRSGLFALERIKGREDSPHVIMVTANEGKRHQEYAEAFGVDAYLLKPVPLGRLIDTVERLTSGDAG